MMFLFVAVVNSRVYDVIGIYYYDMSYYVLCMCCVC